MKAIFILLICSIAGTRIKAIPIKAVENNVTVPDENNMSYNVPHNTTDASGKDLNGESRAGIIDNLNPFDKTEKTQANKNNEGGQNNNPMEAVQNLFGKAPQFLNGSNPFEQLLSSLSKGNFLDDVKLSVGSFQAMLMPASTMMGGLQSISHGLGNMNNLLQPPTGK